MKNNYLLFVNESKDQTIDDFKYKMQFVFPMRIVELVLIIACLALHLYGESWTTDGYLSILFSGTFFGYIIVHLGTIYGYATKTPIAAKIHIFFTAIGCVLYTVCGGLIIYTYIGMTSGEFRWIQLAKGAFSIITGITFFADGIFAYIGNPQH